MKIASAALGAAAVVLASPIAAKADEAKGAISAIDTSAGTVTLSDGKTYSLPQHLAKSSVLKVGDKVTVVYTSQQPGKATAIDVFVDAGVPPR